jgi:hypothetical protein
VLALLLIAGRPGVARAVCPDAGFDAVACDIAEARDAASCARHGARGAVRRALAAVARRTAAARTATDRSLAHLATLRLEQASGRVTALRARLAGLAGHGRLPAGCAAALDGPLDRLATALAGMTGSPSSTSTTTATNATASSTTSTASTSTTTATTSTTLSRCGNGRLDPGEQCDGSNLFGRDCATLGFTGGTLACRPDCLFDTSHCTF